MSFCGWSSQARVREGEGGQLIPQVDHLVVCSWLEVGLRNRERA
jgi:hypothetical protein